MNATAVSKLRAAGKLAINKLQIVQQKESAIAKQNRRQLSQIMAAGKLATAKIKAETVIASDIYVELLELLELYCELIVSRAGLLDPKTDPLLEKDPRLCEAIFTVIYATPSTDVKELASLKDVLLHILPKETSAEAIDNTRDLVPAQVMSRVRPEVPSEELVQLYLTEIARAYQVNVPGVYEVEAPAAPEEKTTETKEPTPTPADGAAKGSASTPAKPAGQAPTDDLWERFNNLKK